MPDLPARRIRALARSFVLPWLARAWPHGLAQHAQRISAFALERIAARFPRVAELIGARAPAPDIPRPARVPEEALLIEHAPLETKTPEQLVQQLEGAGDWQSRAHAAAALAHVDTPEVVDALICALRDPSAEVAAAVAEALSISGTAPALRGGASMTHGARVIGVLHEVVANGDGYFSPLTRAAAITGLARRGEITRVLGAVHDLDAEVSIAAIGALLEHAPEAAPVHLRQVIENRSGYFLPLTRLAAARALDQSGALNAALAAELLAREPDEGVRALLRRRVPA